MTKRKKRTKRGRPRIEGCIREPNGRISRTKMPRDPIDKLAIEMRAKRFCLTLQEAKNPLSGTYIGRLYLQGNINQDQYDAAQKYLEVRNNYLCAKGLPNAVYDDFTPSSNEEAQKRWIERATHCYEEMKEVIKEAQYLHRQHNFYAALQYLVIEDQSLSHLVGSLYVALNALHKHFTQNR
ncbi:hypothetical protein KAE70_00785 [Bartonella henselae]|uniref:hypothetical protein n=1 Tax=Bartonella henselae TaxID=38323 RepID=UPI000969345C|nr:hypothetical protein [Bartonella henselae]OLL54173.1 hypothetical protein AT239_07720 [Bartonella henselae]OLL55957.1 hypothetical protein AT240_06640 [Bartonella henselae]UJM33099.1 hypothetical protein KAE70_00785 [Bartonella henselae]